jgi:membrane-bound serine protease (ClpP class)
LIVFGISLLVLELTVPSFGILGVGGIVALVIGSIMATSAVPGVRVHFGTILPAALLLAAAVLGLGRLALKAQRRPAQAGVDAMIGETGRTRTPLTAATAGQIDVRGEIWRAVSREPLPAGTAVRIVGVDGLTVLVEPADHSA